MTLADSEYDNPEILVMEAHLYDNDVDHGGILQAIKRITEMITKVLRVEIKVTEMADTVTQVCLVTYMC